MGTIGEKVAVLKPGTRAKARRDTVVIESLVSGKRWLVTGSIPCPRPPPASWLLVQSVRDKGKVHTWFERFSSSPEPWGR